MVLIGLLFVVGFVLGVYTISVSLYTAEEAGRLNSVFIATITGIIALGGTLITQLWGGTSSDSDKPIFYFISPLNSAVNVPLDSRIIATSNTQIDPATINTNTFTIKDDKNNKVEGTVTLEGGNAIFKPKESLNPNTKYIVTLTKDVKDLSGRALATEKVWSFTTRK
jgi:hypothetical protein